MFVFLLIALIFIFFSLVNSFFSFLLAAILPPCISPVMFIALVPWNSFNLESWFHFGSLLAKQVFPSSQSSACNCSNHRIKLINNMHRKITHVTEGAQEKERGIQILLLWISAYICVCVCVHLWHMYAFLCVCVWYIHCCSYCYKMLFQMEHLLITTLNLFLYTVNSLYTPCLHTTADCTFILWWHIK